MDLLLELHYQNTKIKNFWYRFTSETSLKELHDTVKKLWSLDYQYQKICFENGKDLDGSPNAKLITLGCDNETKIYVNHCELSKWVDLPKIVESFTQSKNSEEKKVFFNQAKILIKILEDSRFFGTYSDYFNDFHDIHRTLYKYPDRRPEEMQNVIKAYFDKKLFGKNPTYFFFNKNNGSRAGLICKINYLDGVNTYYLKTNDSAGRSKSPSCDQLNMKEFFIYRLLEKLRVGASIHFLTSLIGSETLVYIASREIPNFKTLEEIEQKERNFENYVLPAIQILTVFTVLSIGDCHSENVGVDKNGRPFIVDFCLDRLGIDNIESGFRKHVRCLNHINKLLDEYSIEDKVKIGDQFLKSIDFIGKFEETLHDYKEKDEKAFYEEGLHFPPNATEDLKQYAVIVKENANKFFNYPN